MRISNKWCCVIRGKPLFWRKKFWNLAGGSYLLLCSFVSAYDGSDSMVPFDK